MGNIKYILSGHVQRLINEEKLTPFIKRKEKNRLQQYFESTDNDFYFKYGLIAMFSNVSKDIKYTELHSLHWTLYIS